MRVLLFTGKGGVGKTTLAAASAARVAATGRKALVVSTDPAHSLADVLDVPLGARPVEVDGAPGLYAAQVDARQLVDDAWPALREHLGAVLAGAGVDEVAAEELTVLPGVEELLALAEVHDLADDGPWEVVLVDCAPTAETLRLLALPEAVAGYLERLFPAHRRMVRGLLGGAGASSFDRWAAAADALSRLAERLGRLRAMLTDPAVTGVRLVFTPERVVVAEVRRTLTALSLLGIRVDGLVANRLVPAPAVAERGESASWLRARRAEQDDVLARLRSSLPPELTPCTVGHRSAEPIGLASLAAVADELDLSDVVAVGSAVLPGAAGVRPAVLPGAAAARPGAPVSVRRTAGAGRSPDSEFELRLALSLTGSSAVDLARVGDELAVTIDGHRRLIALPSVLRRCLVVGARQHDDGLTVRFHPDPDVWMR